MKESIADCIATIRMKTSNIKGESVIKIALDEIKIEMNAIGFPKSSIESRELNIKKKKKKNVSVNFFIDGILKNMALNKFINFK